MIGVFRSYATISKPEWSFFMFPLPVFELVFVNGHKISPRHNEPCESLCNKIDLVKITKVALARVPMGFCA